ncbi:hypothetical protein QOZ80_6AG0547960 [Eleusine coracana subsp. coracana]|nr:hypothetical protein QOZ80_6AG0547960 [Eleusine coracana subsp. coracana]
MANQGAIPIHIGHDEGRRELLINSARLLMVWGAAVVISTVAGNMPANATNQAIAGLLLWVLGVCLLALVPAAERFPRAAVIAAAVANAVVRHLFTPWN